MSKFYIPKGGSATVRFFPLPGYHYLFDTHRLKPVEEIVMVPCSGLTCKYCIAIHEMREAEEAIARWENEGGAA